MEITKISKLKPSNVGIILFRALDKLKKFIKQIGFSGGEALMYREMLLKCMAHAKKRGLSSTLVTNCSFEGNFEKTKNILQK